MLPQTPQPVGDFRFASSYVLIANVNDAIRRHRNGEALADDKTLLAIEVRK